MENKANGWKCQSMATVKRHRLWTLAIACAAPLLLPCTTKAEPTANATQTAGPPKENVAQAGEVKPSATQPSTAETVLELKPLKLADGFKIKSSLIKENWINLSLSALSQNNGTTSGMASNQYTSSNLITFALQIGPFTRDSSYQPAKQAISVDSVQSANWKRHKAYERIALNAVFTQRTGQILSNLIPNILNTQWGYGNGPIARLNILNLEYRDPQAFLSSIKIGKLTQAQDFTVNPVQCFFSNFGLCGWAQGTPYMVSIPGNPFNSYGAVVKFGREDQTRLKYGVYQLAPATFATQYHGLDFRFDQGIGTAQFLELNIPLNSPKRLPIDSPLLPASKTVDGRPAKNALYETVLPPTTLTVGGWYGSGQFATVTAAAKPASYGSQNNGLYGIASLRLPFDWLGADNRVFVASSIGLTPQVQNFTSGGNAGLVVAGVLAKRPFDTLGLGFAYGTYNPNYYLPGTSKGTFTPTNEYALELNYNIAIDKSISIMPNYQYIIQPGGNQGRSGVSVIGLQIWIRF